MDTKRGVVAGVVALAAVVVTGGYGIAVAHGGGAEPPASSSASMTEAGRGHMSAGGHMQHNAADDRGMGHVHGEMGEAHREAMRSPEMRRMHREHLRDAQMRRMHRQHMSHGGMHAPSGSDS